MQIAPGLKLWRYSVREWTDCGGLMQTGNDERLVAFKRRLSVVGCIFSQIFEILQKFWYLILIHIPALALLVQTTP